MRCLLSLVSPISLAGASSATAHGEVLSLLQRSSAHAPDHEQQDFGLSSVGGVRTCNGRPLEQFYRRESLALNGTESDARLPPRRPRPSGPQGGEESQAPIPRVLRQLRKSSEDLPFPLSLPWPFKRSKRRKPKTQVLKKFFPPLAIVPYPLSVRRRSGNYSLTPQTRLLAISVGDTEGASRREFMETVSFIAERLRAATGWEFPVEDDSIQNRSQDISGGDIRLFLDGTAPLDAGFDRRRERYRLNVNEDGVEIRAEAAPGIFYAFQTLRQLFPAEIFGESPSNLPLSYWKAPLADIEDEPALGWRGAHLDVSRHFMPLGTVYKFIEVMSVHKLNVFHWHLVDDQGWRLEIKAYPNLTRVGSKRDWSPPGTGYYTQEDVRRVVEFARRRHVMVLPEIEMPGHSRAAIAAYPELGSGRALPVWSQWGINSEVYNTRPGTLQFLRNVLDEVLELFPWKYVHIGGDEVPDTQWLSDSWEQGHMKELGLDNRNGLELQTWFVRQIVEYLESKGRRVVAWNELAKGNIPKSITIMSWEDPYYGVEAAEKGHDVIMVPQQYTYLDRGHADGDPWETFACCLSVEDVYLNDPVPFGLLEDVRDKFVGYQFQVWTEYIDSLEKLEYMTWPRGSALAERMWTPEHRKDVRRLERSLASAHASRLQQMGVRYRERSIHWERDDRRI